MDSNPSFYYEIQFVVSPHSLGTELLLAQLSQTLCESFEETALGLNAYIRSDDWSQFQIDSLELLSDPNFRISHSIHRIPMENWNAQWEASFQPIVVGEYTIRAPFHPPKQTSYELIIEPKMSFGTGHHQTTRLMLESILELDVQGQKVLDMGCGTGILAIVAAQRGALHVDALDIEPWCVENTIENASRNHCGDKVVVSCGDIENTDSNYDLIMANINRNVLLEHLPHYANKLRKGGTLLLSGFFESDVESLHEVCEQNNLTKISNAQLDPWMCLKYVSS
jgi:ribosomal protein L11 methyltransferase